MSTDDWMEAMSEVESLAYKRGYTAGIFEGIKKGKQKAIKAITMVGMKIISEYIEMEDLKG